MMRRLHKGAVVVPTTASRSLAAPPLLASLGGHFAQLAFPSTYLNAAAWATSPVTTLGLVLVAYNVNVIFVKHVWYTLEMLTKDYHQDLQLHQLCRYMIYLSLLFMMHFLFVEA